MGNPTAAFVAAYGAYVAAVHLIDGPWKRWSKGAMVDPWTLTHVGWSMLARRMGVPLPTLMTLAVANEGIEWGVREMRPDLLWGSPESFANAATDVLANYLGYHL